MSARITIVIPDELLPDVEAQKPKSLALSTFCVFLIEKGLTGGLDYAPTVSVRNQPLGNLRSHTGATLPPQQLASEASSEAPLQTVAAPSAQPDLPLEPKKNKTKGSKSSKSKHTKGTPEFEEFWTAYQRCTHKANGQSKAKAWEVYQDVIKEEEPQRLLTAISSAIADIERRTIAGEFASPLPDCFRWLRDEHYAIWLEEHAAQSSNWIQL